MTFAEAIATQDARFAHRPDELGDGVRTIAFANIPPDAPAEIEGAIVRVRVPAPHHSQPHRGWLMGAWSR